MINLCLAAGSPRGLSHPLQRISRIFLLLCPLKGAGNLVGILNFNFIKTDSVSREGCPSHHRTVYKIQEY